MDSLYFTVLVTFVHFFFKVNFIFISQAMFRTINVIFSAIQDGLERNRICVFIEGVCG